MPQDQVEKEITRWSSSLAETTEDAAKMDPGVVGMNKQGDELFMSVCSVCGKSAKTPFKPNPNRPVYCSDCLEKVKKGEIKAPKVIKAPKAEKQALAQDVLAAMGIEFEEVKEAPRQQSSGGGSGQQRAASPANPQQQNQPPRQGGGGDQRKGDQRPGGGAQRGSGGGGGGRGGQGGGQRPQGGGGRSGQQQSGGGQNSSQPQTMKK